MNGETNYTFGHQLDEYRSAQMSVGGVPSIFGTKGTLKYPVHAEGRFQQRPMTAKWVSSTPPYSDKLCGAPVNNTEQKLSVAATGKA